MKIMTLNLWGGKILEPLKTFLKSHADDVDVFCFQEVYHGNLQAKNRWSPQSNYGGMHMNIYSTVSEILQDHVGFHSAAVVIESDGEQIPYGISIFVKKNLEQLGNGTYEIFDRYADLDVEEHMKKIGIWNRLLQYVTINHNGSPLTVFNMHGLHTGKGKDDTRDRLTQSEQVKKFMGNHAGAKILCGDFNLDINTQSLSMLEEGMRNLIKESGTTSTRSHHYPHPTRFADYMLVSPDVNIVSFQVLEDVVSDHLPLLLVIS